MSQPNTKDNDMKWCPDMGNELNAANKSKHTVRADDRSSVAAVEGCCMKRSTQLPALTPTHRMHQEKHEQTWHSHICFHVCVGVCMYERPFFLIPKLAATKSWPLGTAVRLTSKTGQSLFNSIPHNTHTSRHTH